MDCSRFYEVNLWVFTIAYHRMNIQLCYWPLFSKQKEIRGFWKCKVHCCNFKGFKVTSLQSLTRPGFEPRPPAWVNFPMLSDSYGRRGLKSWPGEIWRFVTLKPLKLQQCTLHFWKPPVFVSLDKRDQEHSWIFRLWYAIANTQRFTS